MNFITNILKLSHLKLLQNVIPNKLTSIYMPQLPFCSSLFRLPSINNQSLTCISTLASPAICNNQTSMFATRSHIGIPTLQKYSLAGSFSIRTNIREHFPRPNERKRIKRHGWKKRMSTAAGRKIIMRRLLKGRHILTH